MGYLYDNHSDISEEWKYYNDGKSWLFRTLKKKKTIFWIKVLNDTFIIAFWFADRAEPMIEQSNLTASIKNDFKIAKKYKMGRSNTRSLALTISNANDIDNIIKLIEIKKKLK